MTYRTQHYSILVCSLILCSALILGCSDADLIVPESQDTQALTDAQETAPFGDADMKRGGTKQTTNVMGPMLQLADDPDDLTTCTDTGDRSVYEVDGAKINRNPNSISAHVKIDTPEPGTYCYATGETAVAEEGPPEAFSLWMFTFDEEQGAYEDFPWSGAFLVAGHVVGGPNLTLSGQVSKNSEAFGFPLENTDVEVHLAVAPHGALAPDIMPEQIKTPAGTPGHWWVSIFEEVE